MKKNPILFIFFTLLVSSCAQQLETDIYSSRQVGEVASIYEGIIKNVRIVKVQHGESLDDNTLGLAGGGVTGGLIGDAIGNGRLLPKIAGGVCGALTGALIEKKAKQQTALEYIVELNNGNLMSIVQGCDYRFIKDQPVYIHMSPKGRARIISRE